jgi:hypothetical protein
MYCGGRGADRHGYSPGPIKGPGLRDAPRPRHSKTSRIFPSRLSPAFLEHLADEIGACRHRIELCAFGIDPCQKVRLQADTYERSLACCRAPNTLCVII